MFASPTARPRFSGNALASTWLALSLLGCVACGGGQRQTEEPPLTFADPDDCHCKLTDGDLAPRPSSDATPPRVEEPAVPTPSDANAAPASNPDAAAIARRYVASDAPAPARWTGTPIDFNVKDADLANVLRLLAEVGQVDMVIADDVVGTVTLRLGNVPWDQALDAVIRLERLSVSRNGPILLVRRGP